MVLIHYNRRIDNENAFYIYNYDNIEIIKHNIETNILNLNIK